MKVSVENIDEKSGFYSTRTLRIKIKGKTIKTPYRAITHQELNAKNNIPEDVLLYSHFSVIHRKFTLKEIKEKVLESNKFLSNLIKFLEEYRIRMQHSEFVLPFLQPYESALIADFDKEKYIRLIVRAQIEAGFKHISIPWLRLPAREFLTIIEKHKNDLGESYKIIPVIDIKEKPKELEPIFRYVKEVSTTGELNFFGIIHRPVREALASYDLAWEVLKEADLCIIMLDVKRYQEDLNDVSNIHLNEFVLGDVVSLETIRIFGRKKEKDSETSTKKISRRKKPIEEKLRIFDQDELRVPLLREFMRSSNWVDEISRYFDRSGVIREILENYKEAQGDKEKTKVLNAISRVHEFLASEREFEASREFISKSETEDYISEKATLFRALRNVKGQGYLGL
ncbi:MAG: hypothetical protein J7K36_08875 [Archaeoglobaceae archaeon]|nr:hypothetical protein [Archaeoglobaceae archaeon]